MVLLAGGCASSDGVQVDPVDVEFNCCGDLGVTEVNALVLTPNLTGPRLESVRLDDGNLVIEATPDRGLDSATVVRITVTFESTPKLVAVSVFGLGPREPTELPLTDLVPTQIRLQDWGLDGPISGQVDSRNEIFGWRFWISQEQVATATAS